MLNESRMQIIRPGSHELMRIETDLGTPAKSKKNNLENQLIKERLGPIM